VLTEQQGADWTTGCWLDTHGSW